MDKKLQDLTDYLFWSESLYFVLWLITNNIFLLICFIISGIAFLITCVISIIQLIKAIKELDREINIIREKLNEE